MEWIKQIVSMLGQFLATMAGVFVAYNLALDWAPSKQLQQQTNAAVYDSNKYHDEVRSLKQTNSALRAQITNLESRLKMADIKIHDKELAVQAKISTKADELQYQATKLSLKSQKEVALINRMTSMIRSCVNATHPGDSVKIVKIQGPHHPISEGGLVQLGNEQTPEYPTNISIHSSGFVIQKSQVGVKVLSNCVKEYQSLYQQ